MAGAITPWLCGLIEAEIEAVVTWKSVVKREPGIKPDPEDERFHDDGDNFKSDVSSPPPAGSSRVQLLKVYIQMDEAKAHMLEAAY